MSDAETARSRLEAALAELEARLTHIARDLADTPDRDSQEQAIEIEDDEALEHQAALVEQEIVSVQRALSRMLTAPTATASDAASRSLRNGWKLARKRRCASTALARPRLSCRKSLSYSLGRKVAGSTAWLLQESAHAARTAL